ncbi:hypothetical protein ACWC1D_12365 [Streptomyces sp. NPDC001478]
MNLTAAQSGHEGADAFPPVTLGIYALYAECDGMAVGWEFCDTLGTPEDARALLPEVRCELATLNAAGQHPHTSYIHLLRHAVAGCDCLTTEAPAEDCRVLETFAPQESASGQDDACAARAWGDAAVAKRTSATTSGVPTPGGHWDNYPIQVSNDPAKRDFELVHTACGASLCDVEHGDTLPMLVGMVEDHAAECGRPRVSLTGQTL